MTTKKNSLMIDGTLYETEVPDEIFRRGRGPEINPLEIRAAIPGTIFEIRVSKGEKIIPGQVVAVLEAMKMLNDIEAETAGSVCEIAVSKGDNVEKNQLLVKLEKG